MITKHPDLYTPDNIAEQLAQMLAMDAKDFYTSIASNFMSTMAGQIPIRVRTNFTQTVMDYEVLDDGMTDEEIYQVSAYTNIDAIHDVFLKSSLFINLISFDKIKINENHFRYGVIVEGVGFVPNIKIILNILKAQLLSFRDPKVFSDSPAMTIELEDIRDDKRVYIALIDQAIEQIDMGYSEKLLTYVPVMETPQLQNKFQTLVAALRDILAFKGEPGRTKAMLAACSFINDAVLVSDKYKETDLSWLSDQTFFLPNFIHKASLIEFQEQWEIKYIKNNVNPLVELMTSNLDESKHSIKIIHGKLKEFIEYEAAKIIYSKNINLYNLMHYRNRFLGRVSELMFSISTKKATDAYVAHILNRIVSELDECLDKKQKFNN